MNQFTLTPAQKRQADRSVLIAKRCIECPDAHETLKLSEEVPTEKGCCQKTMRLVQEATYGLAFSEKFRARSAKLAAPKYIVAKCGFDSRYVERYGGLQPGDLLYKTNGEFGHVGEYIGQYKGHEMVAENASTSLGRVRGALGYRTLEEFGHFDIVARPALLMPKGETASVPASAPAPAKAPAIVPVATPKAASKIVLNGHTLQKTPPESLGGVREVLETLGWTLMYARSGDDVVLRAFYEPKKA